MKNTLTFLFLLGLCIANAQTRHYVHASATGANNGQNWQNAFTDLQSALQTSIAGDEIWVAKGTYFPTQDTDRTVSFEPTSGVKLYGGFDGSETDLSQRDWDTNETILSGDIGVLGDSLDNTLTVVHLFQPDSNTILDGFKVCFGVANDNDNAASVFDRSICGGGLVIQAGNWDAFPTVQNCTFNHNSAHSLGGGVIVLGTTNSRVAPRFINCHFEDNYAINSGGGVARFGGSFVERGVEFEDCVFERNQSDLNGGGLYYADTEGPNTVSIIGCAFFNNRASLQGAGAYIQTGKLGKSGLNIEKCKFEGNSSISGASIYLFTNGKDFDGEAKIDSCEFFKNFASNGYIVYADQFGTMGTIVKLQNSIFNDNRSDNFSLVHFSWLNASFILDNASFIRDTSSAVFGVSLASSLKISNSRFLSNIKDRLLFIGFYDSTNDFLCENSVFAENNKHLYSGSLDLLSANSAIFTNCNFLNNDISSFILSNNNVDVFLNNIILQESANPVNFPNSNNFQITHSLLNINGLDCQSPPANVTCINNLFNLDPQFRDTTNHDYSLLPCSPLINAGSNAAAAGILTDLAGNPRILEGTVDIGAYEAPAFAFAVAPAVSPACVGSDGGSIALQPINGCEPYIYDWVPNAGTGPELNGLPAGAYQITLTDASGRQIMDTVLVPEAPQPNVSLATANVVCGNPAGGALTAVVNNGTGPFSYQWLPTAADTFMLKNLPAGAYSLTLTDANGCQDSTSASIALVGALTLSVDGKAIPCYGETGWLSATPLNGAAPFSWLWSGWSGTDSLAQPLTPGNYAVTVSDAYGCTSTFAFPTMTQPDSLSIGTGSDPQSQINPPNGLALVTTISGGTSPFAFDWNTMDMTQAITGLEAGTYTVTVSDTNGCTATAVVIVDFTIGTQNVDNQSLVVFPNPATDWVRMLLPAGDWQVELLDASGRVLRTRACVGEDCVLDLEGLASGGYVLRAWNGAQIWLGRMVKR